jgi:uncharacterized protein YwqG
MGIMQKLQSAFSSAKALNAEQIAEFIKNDLHLEKSYSVAVPEVLREYEEAISSTAKPALKIIPVPEKNLLLWQSKFYGHPYLPDGVEYPTANDSGKPLMLFAQLNFEEIPELPYFPTKGILQFYGEPDAEMYGMKFDRKSEDQFCQDNFRVMYFPEVIKDKSQLHTEFPYYRPLENTDKHIDYGFPLLKPCELSFEKINEPISLDDYRIEMVRREQMPYLQYYRTLNKLREDHSLCETYYKEFSHNFHKIGGYPSFYQGHDPRSSISNRDDYILLFQMSSDREAGICWGDCGTGNFFIDINRLKQADFSEVLFDWQCG